MRTITEQPEVVILSGGDYPSHPIPVNLLHDAEKIACCDGAIFELERHGRTPWRIVGDCDTIYTTTNPDEIRIVEKYHNLIRRISEQEDNDQTKTVRYCLEHGYKKLAIVGATGRREDHTLANISLLAEYLRLGADVRLYTDHGYFVACQDIAEFSLDIPEAFQVEDDSNATRPKSIQISVFNVSAHNFTSEGLRYPLYNFTQWWQGTLNEAIAPKVVIKAQGVFIVFVTYS